MDTFIKSNLEKQILQEFKLKIHISLFFTNITLQKGTIGFDYNPKWSQE